MPLYLFYTMVQKSQKWPKTQIKGGGGSWKTALQNHKLWYDRVFSAEWGTCTTSSSVLKIAQEGAARPAGWHWVAPSPAGPMTAVCVRFFVGAQERSALPEWPKRSLFSMAIA